MRLKPVAAILLRQWYLLRGSPVRALPMFAWVGIDIVLWGFISRYLDSVTAAGINFTAWSLGRADHNGGKRNLWLRTLDRFGLGFDS